MDTRSQVKTFIVTMAVTGMILAVLYALAKQAPTREQAQRIAEAVRTASDTGKNEVRRAEEAEQRIDEVKQPNEADVPETAAPAAPKPVAVDAPPLVEPEATVQPVVAEPDSIVQPVVTAPPRPAYNWPDINMDQEHFVTINGRRLYYDGSENGRTPPRGYIVNRLRGSSVEYKADFPDDPAAAEIMLDALNSFGASAGAVTAVLAAVVDDDGEATLAGRSLNLPPEIWWAIFKRQAAIGQLRSGTVNWRLVPYRDAFAIHIASNDVITQ
jgi:hypothetical protein